jgi:hypothetical protein
VLSSGRNRHSESKTYVVFHELTKSFSFLKGGPLAERKGLN